MDVDWQCAKRPTQLTANRLYSNMHMQVAAEEKKKWQKKYADDIAGARAAMPSSAQVWRCHATNVFFIPVRHRHIFVLTLTVSYYQLQVGVFLCVHLAFYVCAVAWSSYPAAKRQCLLHHDAGRMVTAEYSLVCSCLQLALYVRLKCL